MEDPFYESLMARSPLGRGYQAAPSQSGPVDPEEQKRKEDTDGWFADTLMAIPRGVAGAVESVGELGNLFGADYDLPDNFGLGHSTSLPGSLTQGTIQFLTGFLPGSWGVGHLSKLGKLSKAVKVTKAAPRSMIRKAAGSSSARMKAAQLLNAADRTSKGYRRAMYGRAMAVGAFADFTVFAEDEARLSNMLQQIPGLEENMVLEFLAQDDEDSAIESRLKNVLEGGMAGVAVDGVLRVLRGLGRRAKILRDPKMPQEKKLTALEPVEKYIVDGAEQGLLGRAEAHLGTRFEIDGTEFHIEDATGTVMATGQDAPTFRLFRWDDWKGVTEVANEVGGPYRSAEEARQAAGEWSGGELPKRPTTAADVAHEAEMASQGTTRIFGPEELFEPVEFRPRKTTKGDSERALQSITPGAAKGTASGFRSSELNAKLTEIASELTEPKLLPIEKDSLARHYLDAIYRDDPIGSIRPEDIETLRSLGVPQETLRLLIVQRYNRRRALPGLVKYIEDGAEQGLLGRAGDEVVVRREEPGSVPDASKPQGLYLNKDGRRTGIVEEGEFSGLPGMTEEFKYTWRPKNPLDVEGLPSQTAIRDQRGVHIGGRELHGAAAEDATEYTSAGIQALAKLIDPVEFKRLAAIRSKREMAAELAKMHPSTDWMRYHDGYEMLEGLAGIEARKAGYDSILHPDERVALTSDVIKPLEPTGPKPAVVRDADLLDLDSMKYPELQAEARQRGIPSGQKKKVLQEQIAGHRRNERGARASREGMINRLDDPVPGLPDVKMRGRGAAQIALEEGAITWDEGIELVKRIDDFIDSGADLMEKIPGLINTATLSTRANMALAHVYRENFPEGIKHLDSRGNQMDKAFVEGYTEEAALRSLADMTARTPKEIEIQMARDTANVGSASLNVQGYIHYIDNYFNHLMELGHAMKTGDPKALKALGMTQQQVTAAYGKAHQTAGELLKSFGGVRQEFGRGLYSFRTDVYGKAARLMNGEFAERMGREMGGRDHLVDIHDQLLELRGIGGLKNNAALAQRLMRFDRKARATFMLNEYFVNMVLSSIRTLSTNTLGNTATTLFGPIEVMMGARVKKGIATLRGQDTKALTQEVHRATLELTELRSTFTMAAKWAKEAWKKGDYIADPSHAFHDIPTHMKDAWGAENLGFITGRELDPAKGLGKAVEKFGTVLRLPSRSLMATDEFFKQWNYRSTVSADLILAGRIKVKNGEIKNLDEWVDKELHALTERGQFFVESNLQKEAAKRFKPEDARYNHGSGWDQMQRDRQGWIKKQMGDPAVLDRGAIGERAANISRERTFTNDLDPDNGVLSSLGVSMQKFGYKHPMFRLFVPFIRTPLNIFIYAGRRTAIPYVNRDLNQAAAYLYKTKFGSKGLDAARTKMARELSSSDPRVQAEAMGRMTSAIGFGTVFVGLASSGILTGAGPKDKDRRAIMKQAGWQPYSVKIGDKYVSYQKLDPLATVTGIWADIVDFARYAERDGQPEVEKVMMGVIVSLAHNLQSKSYLQGLTQIAGVISDPEINASKMTGRLAAALTVPSLVASMRELTDPNMVEVRSVLDQVISRVPFLSTALLDPQRTVLGEAVDKKTMEGAERLASDLGGVFLPILTNTSTDDVIHRELAELGYPFGNPPRNKYGVDLTDHKNSKGQTAYDRWLELVGTTTLGLTTKRSLRSSLKRLINSRAYQALPVDGVSEVDQDSPRVALITRMITRYRAVARMQMLREFPDVARAARNQLVANRAMSQGVDPEMIRNQLFPME